MNEPRIFKARFFDGHSIREVDAIISLLPEGLKIQYESEGISYEIHWPSPSLQVMEQPYRQKPALIGSKSMLGARLVLNNIEDYSAVIQLIPRRNIKHSHVHHPWRTMTFIIAAILLLFILPIWKIHTVSTWVANILPYQWEQLFWKNMIRSDFDQLIECSAPKGNAALKKLVEKLSKAGNLQHPLDVKVIFAPETINAESLPGYHILIYSGLLKAINDPNAIAAIIAHEMGHSVYHHVIAQYLSKMGLSAFFEALLGLSRNNVAFDFLSLKYTRDFEIQADKYSIMILKQANISPAGFQNAMKQLEKLSGEFEGVEPYLVDHPTYKERLDLVNEEPNFPAHPEPSLTPQEWKALQSICDQQKPIKFLND